jgi:hypothetical protein
MQLDPMDLYFSILETVLLLLKANFYFQAGSRDLESHKSVRSRRAPRIFPWGEGGWHWGYIYFMFDFKIYIIKIMF